MASFCKSLLVSCVAAGIIGAASAQEAEFPDFPNYVPSVAPARVSPDLAPTIDGDLSDPIWAQATQITDFYSVEPIVGTPTEDTIVYMAYDENALYVAGHAFDSNPDAIITRIMERDGEVWRDDMLRFYIDPFNTQALADRIAWKLQLDIKMMLPLSLPPCPRLAKMVEHLAATLLIKLECL